MDNFPSKLSNYEDICLIDFGTIHTIFKNEKYFSHLSMCNINVTTVFGSKFDLGLRKSYYNFAQGN